MRESGRHVLFAATWRSAVLNFGKLLAFFLSAVLLFNDLGCGKQKEEGVTISFLDTEDKNGAWAEVIATFEAMNPGSKVRLIEGPASTDTRESQYATSLLARDSTYDLIYLDVVWVPKFSANGWLVPLDEYFPPALQEEFLPGDIQASTYAGHIWRIPIRSNGGMLYYRKDLLESANLEPPRTFEELVDISQKLQNPPDVWGFVFQGKQYEGLTCVFLEILRGFGGDVLSPDGRCVFDSPESVATLTWMRDAIFQERIVPEAVRTYEENESLVSFLSGKSIFMRNWPYAWKVCNEEGSEIGGKVGIIPMPHVPDQSSSSTSGGWGFGVSQFSRHKDEALKFAFHAARPESLKVFARKQGGAPSRKSLYKDSELVALFPHYPELYEVLIHAQPRPVHPRYAEMSDVLQRHVSAVLTDTETPEGAVREAAGEINEILARSS
ncbi:MAG: ABC transporter substrate-binding protein [Candidatus Abyssobacteria bacterium SURF_17]|uniref:ABC transporter substrate-binding protein n=1 Tax=Candidatus Abyssobacteria bacterium SURF_17 TaxID=2093361 RepID=A0A419EXX6_9BACT|nr:MAG: ABC transporter substrate-binding protein [Candidatus Abyssubacteria bacterium SURF_17]